MGINGLLTRGLMGHVNNLLLSYHYLQLEVDITVQPIFPGSSGGSMGAGREREERRAYLHFKVRYKQHVINKTYEMSEGKAFFLFKRFSGIKQVTKKASIFIDKLMMKPIQKVKITIRNK